MYWLLLVPWFHLCFAGSDPGPPILLVPGLMENQLEAKLSENWANRAGCPKTGEWFRLWLDVRLLLTPDSLRCFADMMEMHYDPVLDQSVNAEGVQLRVPGFGDTSSTDYIDPSWRAYLMGNIGAAFAPLIDELESWGYTRGLDVTAAPYDFRLAPASLLDYHDRLKDLIETMYSENHSRKVAIVSHSAGGLVSHYFLNHQTQEWKDQFIDSFVSIATPWMGAPLSLRAATSGFDFHTPVSNILTIRTEQRAAQMDLMMLPKFPAWNREFIFVSSPHRNYTLENIDQLFEDIAFTEAIDIMNLLEEQHYNLDHPGVDVYCYYGTGLDTQDSYVYGEGFPNVEPSIIRYIDGDGTVPTKSANACEIWTTVTEYGNKLKSKNFNLVKHTDLIKDMSVLSELKLILFK